MTKFDHETEALIDLGDATVETKGGSAQDHLDTGVQKYNPIGLSAD
jgi:hypothetical protein